MNRYLKPLNCLLLLAGLASASVGSDMRFTTTLDRSGVDAPGYALDVWHDLSTPETVARISPEGWATEWTIKEFSLVDGGTRYSFDFLQDPPDIYPIATGPLFNEFHLVNMVLRDGGGAAWPGLAVLSFYSFADRTYVKVRFVTYSGGNSGYVVHYDDGAVLGDNFVYKARTGFAFSGSSSVSEVRFKLECSQDFPALGTPLNNEASIPSTHMGFGSTTPGATGVFSAGPATTNILDLSYSISETWLPDENHEFGFMFAPGDDTPGIDAVLAHHGHLAALSFTAPGRTIGFSPLRGLWAVSDPYYTGTDKGVILDTGVTLGNSASDPVEVVVDHRNAWGGSSASYTRDAAGEPWPMLPQHYMNFGEHGPQGEDSGSRRYNRFTVPASQSLQYTFQSLYLGGATNSTGFHYDWIQRNTLSWDPNVHALSHYTINRYESLTIRHDPILTTDWRKHPDNIREDFDVVNSHSVSAADTVFFQVELAGGELLKLVSTDVEISQSGPFFVEEIHTVESVPEGVGGTIRFWNAAWMDEEYGQTTPVGEGNSRWAAEVDLTVAQALSVNTGADIPISVLDMKCNAPGNFQWLGYSSPSSDAASVNVGGELHTLLALPQPFYAGFYQAQNGINRYSASGTGLFLIPYGDVSGNPFHAVWDWDVEFNGSPSDPVLELDSIPPAVDPAAFYRTWHVVPDSTPSTINAGSRIAFKMMGSSGGDSNTGVTYGQTHFNTWKDISVTAVKGTVLSEFPPRILADANGDAEFTVSGGTEWIPVTVVGIDPDTTHLFVESGSDVNNLQAMSAPVDGEPWYQVKTDAETGLVSVSLPVRTQDPTLPRSRYVRVTSGTVTPSSLVTVWLDSGIAPGSINTVSPYLIGGRDATWDITAAMASGLSDIGAEVMSVRMVTFNVNANSRQMHTAGGNGLAIYTGGNDQWMDGTTGETGIFQLTFYSDAAKTTEITGLDITLKSINARIHTSGSNLAMDAFAGSGVLDLSALDDSGTVSLGGTALAVVNDGANSFASDLGLVNPAPNFLHNTIDATGSLVFGEDDSIWLRRRNLAGGDLAYQLAAITFELSVQTPESLYAGWLALYPTIGSSTNLADNPDGDVLNNLAEYALGGAPDDPHDLGHVLESSLKEAAGTNYIEYVYAKRKDSDERGLAYSLEQSSDLLSGTWSNANAEVVGTGSLDAEFDSVTNRVPTTDQEKGFIHLRIGF